MSEPAALKYRAFISDSHADTASAKRLHRGLEGFHGSMMKESSFGFRVARTLDQ